MLTQLSAIQVNMKLLRPERKQRGEAVDTCIRIAIMPTVDQAKRLCMPIPMPSRMHSIIHCILHLIQVTHLVLYRLYINASYMWIKRTKQDWNLRTYSVHSRRTNIVEARKVFRRYIQKSNRRIKLHFFIAALHSVCKSLSSVIQLRLLIKIVACSLTEGKQDADSCFMIGLDSFSEHITRKLSPTATGWICKTYPGNTCKISLRIALYA